MFKVITFKEKTYLFITKENIYIIEGLNSPQFRNHKSFFWRFVCFFISLLLWGSHSYPKKDCIIQQTFPNIKEHWKRLLYLSDKNIILVRIENEEVYYSGR